MNAKKLKNSTKVKPRKSWIYFTRGLSEIEIKFVRSAAILKMANAATLSLEQTLQHAGCLSILSSSVTGAIFSGGIDRLLKQLNGSWDILARKGLMTSRRKVWKSMTPQIFEWIMNESGPNLLELTKAFY